MKRVVRLLTPGRQHSAWKGLLGADCFGGRGCQPVHQVLRVEKRLKGSQPGRRLCLRGDNSKQAED